MPKATGGSTASGSAPGGSTAGGKRYAHPAINGDSIAADAGGSHEGDGGGCAAEDAQCNARKHLPTRVKRITIDLSNDKEIRIAMSRDSEGGQQLYMTLPGALPAAGWMGVPEDMMSEYRDVHIAVVGRCPGRSMPADQVHATCKV